MSKEPPNGPNPTEDVGDFASKVSKPPQKETSTKRSWVWDHFTLPEKVIGKRRATCKFCGQSYAADSKQNGTTSLANHLVNVCSSPENPFTVKEDELDKGQTTLNFHPLKSGETLQSVSQFCPVRAKKALARMLIKDELPFRFVEGEGFQEFVRVICPKWTNMPGRITMSRECVDCYVLEKLNMKKFLKGKRVCLTTDTWTSVQNLNYMCLTAHFIDNNWKMHKRILNFCLVENHKGSTLGKGVETCLLEWGIDKILTLTVDNASSNSLVIDFLKKKTQNRKGTILQHEFLHLRCCAHILNLIVSDGLKDMNECIIKVRNVVKYVRSTPQRLKTFKLCAEKEKLPYKHQVVLDVATRWNYTYEMLGRAEKYQKAFERLEEEDSNFLRSAMEDLGGDGGRRITFGIPTSDDWEKVRLFVKFLKIFYDATLRFSGSQHVTANGFIMELLTIQDTIESDCTLSNEMLKNVAMNMMAKFKKYWGNIDNMNYLLFVAFVLDPRYKLKMIEFSFNSVPGLTEKVKDSLTRLYGAYVKRDGISNPQEKVSQSNSMVSNDSLPKDMKAARLASFHKHLKDSQSLESKSEIDRYLGESLEDDKDGFDILVWWKKNESRYRVLSLVARDVLAIPVSTVASESTFSTAGRVIDPFRSSLHPSTVEALICTQNWIRSSPISLREAMNQIEDYEKLEEIHEKIERLKMGENVIEENATVTAS